MAWSRWYRAVVSVVVTRLFLMLLLAVGALALLPSAFAAGSERVETNGTNAAACSGPCPIVVFGLGTTTGTVEAVTHYLSPRPDQVEQHSVAPGVASAIYIDEFSEGASLRPLPPTFPFRGWSVCPGTQIGTTCRIPPGFAGSACVVFGEIPPSSSCPPPFVQAYKKGNGKGTITATVPGRPTGVCDPACPAGIWTNFVSGDVVTLTATASLGTFLGWEQCPSPSGSTCTVRLENTFPICAVFSQSGPPIDTACPQTTPPRPPPPPDLPPNTRITAGPSPTRATRSRRATFRFRSTEARSTFICRLDSKAWLPCRSPKVLRNLRPGTHTFRAKAIDRGGKIDRTAAVRRWRIRA